MYLTKKLILHINANLTREYIIIATQPALKKKYLTYKSLFHIKTLILHRNVNVTSEHQILLKQVIFTQQLKV